MAAGYPLALSGSEFSGLSSWRCDRHALLRLRDHFRQITAALSAKSAVAERCADISRTEMDAALSYQLLGILKARQRQLENPVGFDILQSSRESSSSPKEIEAKLRDASSKPYKFLTTGGDKVDPVRPYFLREPPTRFSLSLAKKKTRGVAVRSIMERSRAKSFQTKVEDFKERVRKLDSSD